MKMKLPKELRDKFYFIDYLRLHKFGKDQGIWSKNRNMLVKEDEYSNDFSIVARKGYKSYIQRCMHSILTHLFPNFDIIKPRSFFGYEIGKKYDREDNCLDLQNDEDKIKYILSRYLTSGTFEDIVSRYKRIIDQNPNLKYKNRDAGIKISLDPDRSMAYQVVKDLVKIKELQTEMIQIVENKEALIKEITKAFLHNARILPKGTKVKVASTNREGTIEAASVQRVDTQPRYYLVRMSNGNEESYHREQLVVLEGNEQARPIDPIRDAIAMIIEYANQNFRETMGVNKSTIFNLSRSAILRNPQNGLSSYILAEIRGYQPDAEILDQIIPPSDESSDEENDADDFEEVELTDEF